MKRTRLSKLFERDGVRRRWQIGSRDGAGIGLATGVIIRVANRRAKL